MEYTIDTVNANVSIKIILRKFIWFLKNVMSAI